MKKITDILVDDGVKSGVYLNIEAETHHGRNRMSPSRLASGLLDHREIDPSAIRMAYEGSLTFTAAQQDRMDRGTLAHLALLQPEKLVTHVAVWYGGKRAGAEWNEFEVENASKLIVKRDDYDFVMDAVKQFRFNKEINDLLSDGDTEVELVSKEGRIFVCGQVDFVKRGRVKIVDLKSTDAGLHDKALEYTTRDQHYREKMSCYWKWLQREQNVEVEQCWNVFLRLKPPVGIVARKFTTQALEWGWARMLAALQSVDECLDKGWPIYFRSDISDVAPFEMDEGEEVTFGGETI